MEISTQQKGMKSIPRAIGIERVTIPLKKFKDTGVLIALFLLFLLTGFQNSSAQTSFRATLSSNQTFYRPNTGSRLCGASTYGTFTSVSSGSSIYSYATQAFTVSTAGNVTITVTGNTVSDPMLLVYNGSFSTSSPTANFKVGDDDTGGSLRPSIACQNYFNAGTYVIVATSYSSGAQNGTIDFTISSGSGTTLNVLPTVSTSSASSIGSTSVTLGGNISSDGGASVTARGVAYSTSQNPTTGASMGSGTGSFNGSISGLSPGTTYYARAYATNSVGTAYGTQVSFTTISTVAPSVTTGSIGSVTQNSASCVSSNVTSTGGATVTAEGIYYGTSPSPTTNATTGSGNPFTINLTGLAASTRYYVRAYATNSAGTGYGADQSFVTNHIVTYTAGANGSVTGTTTQSIANGGSGTAVTAIPNSNYHFLNWSDGSTANPRTDSNVTSSKTVTANFAINKLSFNPQPSSTVAGQNIAFTVRIVDSYGNTMTNSDGNTITIALGTNAGGGTLAGTLVLTPSGGVASSGNVWINKTGNGYTLTANSTLLTGATSGGFSITPAAIDHFTVAGITDPVIAGETTSPVVTAFDQYDNIKTNYTGTIAFSSDDPYPAVLPVNYTFVAGDNGVHTFFNGVILKTTVERSVTVTDIATSKTGSQTSITVIPAAIVTYTLVANGPITAGTPFTVTATAYDMYGNLKTNYEGDYSVLWTTTATSSLNGTPRIIPANGNQTFTSGVATIGGFTFYNSMETPTITITDGPTSSPGTTDPITVLNAPLDNFKVVAGQQQTSGIPFDVTVTARDVYWNTCIDYTGSIRFKSSADELPAGEITYPVNLQSFVGYNGVRTFAGGVTINPVGAYWLRVGDSQYAYKSGDQQDIVVAPGAFQPLASISTVTIDSPDKIAGQNVIVTLTPRDAQGNLLYSCQNIAVLLDGVETGVPQSNGTTPGSDGVYVYNVQVTNTTSPNVISATLDGVPFDQTYTITVTPAPPSLANTIITPDAGSITTDGSQLVTVQLKDQYDNDRTTDDGVVTLTTDLGGFTGNNGSQTVTAVYAGNGTYTATLFASYDAGNNGVGTAAISGSIAFNTTPGPGVWSGASWPGDGNIVDQAGVEITEGLPNLVTSTIATDKSSMTTDETATITVQLKDHLGNLIVNDRGEVTLASDRGVLTNLGYLSSGQYTATLTAGTTPINGVGLATISGSFAGAGTASAVTGDFNDGESTPANTITTVDITEGLPDVATIDISTADSEITADGSTLITVQLKDALGNLIVNNLGTISLSTSLGVIDNGTDAPGATDITANYTADGKYTATFKMNGIGVGDATITGKIDAASISDNAIVTVINGVATQLAIATPPATAYQAIAGILFDAQPVIHIKDQWGNLVITGTGSNATVTATRVTGTADLQGTTAIAAVAGVVTFTDLNYNVAESITINFASGLLTDQTSDAIDVVHNVPDYMVISGNSTQTAGVAQTITIKIYDAYGNPANRFAGDRTLTFSGANLSPAPPYNPTIDGTNFGLGTAITFTAGEATASMVLYKEETADIAANFTDGSYSDTYTGVTSVNIDAALANRLNVVVSQSTPAYLAITGNGTQIAGEAQTITIRAYDDFNNLATGYSGTKTIKFAGANVSLTPSTSPTAGVIDFGSDVDLEFTNGEATTSMILYKAETASIMATDQAPSGITTPAGYKLAVDVSNASASYFAVTGTSSTQVAGTSQTITVSAYDQYNNPALDYSGDKDIVFSGASASDVYSAHTATSPTVEAVEFGSATTLTFTSGVATGSMSLYKVELASIVATAGSITTPEGYQKDVTVTHNTATYLAITGSGTQIAGDSQDITITAYDAYNNVATGYAGGTLTFTGANPSPVPATNPTGSNVDFGTGAAVAFTNGVVTVPMELYKVETAHVTVSDGDINSDNDKLDVVVSHAIPAYLTITGSGTQTAGVSQTITISAFDAYNNPATGYTGDKSLTFSGASSSPEYAPDNAWSPKVDGTTFGSATSLTFVDGVVSASLDLYKVETAQITVTDETINADSHKLSVAISQAAPAYLAITGSSTQTAGISQTITLTAYDAYNNPATNYSGSKNLTFGGAGVSPSGAAPVTSGTAFGTVKALSFVSGAVTTSMNLYKTETAVVTVTDGLLTEGNHPLSVLVGPTILKDFVVQDVPDPHDLGTWVSATVIARDTYQNIKTNYTGKVTFSNTDIYATNPADYIFTLADNGTHIFADLLKFSQPGDWWLTALDWNDPTKYGAQPDITVQRAVTITANNRTKTYGDNLDLGTTEFSVAGIVPGVDPVAGEITGVTLTSAGSAVTATVDGSPYDIVPSAATGTYTPGYYRIVYENTGKLTVDKRDLTLSNFTADSKTYDGITNVSGTGFSDDRVNSDELTFDYTAEFTDKNAAAAKTVNYTGITISGGTGAGNYNLVTTSGSTTADIAVRDINVTAQTDTKVYDGDNSSAVSPVVDELQTGDIVSSAGIQTFDDELVNTSKVITPGGTVIDDGNGGANYAIHYITDTTGEISQKELTVINAVVTTKPYDGNTDAEIIGAELSGIVGSDDVVLENNTTGTFALATVGIHSVETTPMTISGAMAGNYILTQPTLSGEITQKELTVINAVVTTKVYDGNTDAEITGAELSGVVGSDDVVLGNLISGTFASKNVGTGIEVTSSMTISGTMADNYSLTQPTLSGDITAKPITGDFTADNKVYDGGVDATILTQTLNGVELIDDGKVFLSGGTATFADENVADNIVVTSSGMSLTGDEAANYSLTSVGTTTANITPLDITGNFTVDATKEYDGGTLANVTGRTLNGVINSDDVALSGGIANYDNKNVGTGKTVTLTGMSLAGSKSGNYNLTSVGTITANITVRTLHLSNFGADSKFYDGTTTATGIGFNDDRVSGDNLAFYREASFVDPSVGTGKNVNYSNIAITGGLDKNNYVLASSTGVAIADIWAKAITATVTGVDKEYDGNTDATVLLSGNFVSADDVALNYTSASFADAAIADGKTVTVSGISLTGTDAGQYSLASATGTTTANITQKVLTIGGSFTAEDKPFDGTTDATIATNNLTLVGIVGSDDVSINAAVAFTDASKGDRTVVLTASSVLEGADADKYTLSLEGAPTATANISGKALHVINAVAQSRTYDGTDVVVISGATINTLELEAGATSVTLNNATSGILSQTSVGLDIEVTTSMTLSGADAANYTLVQPTLTADIITRPITITADLKSKVYGEIDPALTYHVSSGSLVSGDSFTGSLTRTPGENVGAYQISQGLVALNANYNLTFASADLSINKAVLTVTADAQTKLYGAANPILTYQYSGWVNGVETIDTPPTASTTVTASSSAGLYSNSIALFSGLDNNYSFNYVAANFTVTKAPLTITASNDTKAYNGLAYSGGSGISYSGFVNSETAAVLGGTLTYVGSSQGAINKGDYTITPGGLTSANYAITFVNGTLTIGNALLTITATSATKTYDGLTYVGGNGVTYSGFLGSDDASVLTGTLSYTGSSQSEVNVGNYIITPGGLSSVNYDIAWVNGNLTVNPAVLHVDNATAQNKVYDGNADAVISNAILRASDIVTGDDVSLTNETSGVFAQVSVGNNLAVSTSMSLSGTDKDNYTLLQPVDLTASITARTVTIAGTFTANDKQFDGTVAATIASNNLSLVGVIEPDEVTLNAVATMSDASKGTDKTVSLTSSTLTGAAAGNYSLSFVGAPSATASISSKMLTISGGFTALNKVYDGTPEASINNVTLSLNGVAPGDDVALTAIAAFPDQNKGTAKVVSLLGSVLSGASAGNYSLSFTGAPSATADITAKTLTVTGATADNKDYDGTADATISGASLSGIISGDDVILVTTTGTFAQSAVGSNIAVTANLTMGGADAGNYTLLQPTGLTANILAIDQTISLTAGWNIISFNVLPVNQNMMSILQSLVNEGSLLKVMDESGNSIENVGGWLNDIGSSMVPEGYKVKVSQNTTLDVQGSSIELPVDIQLTTGWNIISYPDLNPQSANALLQDLMTSGKLVKVMDESGNAIENVGGEWLSEIEYLIPGEGYKVKVNDNCTLTINEAPKSAIIVSDKVFETTSFNTVFKGNGYDHMNVYLLDLAASGIRLNDEIGVYDGKYCVGAVKIDQKQIAAGRVNIPVSCNDGLTSVVNGYTKGNVLSLKLHRDGQESNLSFSMLYNSSDRFMPGSSALLKASVGNTTGINTLSDNPDLKCFPNPFNQELSIELNYPEGKMMNVEIFDVMGRKVIDLYKGVSAGYNLIKWNGTNKQGVSVTPGVYYVRCNGLVSKGIIKN